MLRQDPSGISPDSGDSLGVSARDAARSGDVDIQRELNRLEELILESPRVPLTRRTLIDEEELLEQLDVIRLSLPEAFHEAEAILRHKEEIFLESEQYAREIIESAERRAAQILNEMGIMRQAELESQQLRQQVQRDCEELQDETLAEVERMRRQVQQDIEEMRRMSLAEAEAIQAGADEYADRVLRDVESQLAEMMRIIRNGRQQLQGPPPEPRSQPRRK